MDPHAFVNFMLDLHHGDLDNRHHFHFHFNVNGTPLSRIQLRLHPIEQYHSNDPNYTLLGDIYATQQALEHLFPHILAINVKISATFENVNPNIHINI